MDISQVWLFHEVWLGKSILDESAVAGITPALTTVARTKLTAQPLLASAGVAYLGSALHGPGFLLTADEANELIARDESNRDVLFPYLSGKDVNQHPRQQASRWVINFFDWPLEEAQSYVDCMGIVEERVKPERSQNNRPLYRTYWWRHGEHRPGLYLAIRALDRVGVIAQTSNTGMPVLVNNGQVFGQTVTVFASNDYELASVLSSSFHNIWITRPGSSMLKSDIRYTPTDCFETFPQPALTDAVGDVGRRLDVHRRALMLERWEGLTKTYNKVHNPDERAQDIVELRRLHVELDHAVAAAYGWDNLPLDYDFHETRQGIRYTLGPVVRQEVLDRLLELNHERYADEIRRGLHDKKGAAKRGRGPRRLPSSTSEQATLEGL